MWWCLAVQTAVAGCTLDGANYSADVEFFSSSVIHAVAEKARGRGRGRSRRHAWGNQAAHEGLVFIEVFVGLVKDPPEPEYMPASHFEKASTLGYYDEMRNRIVLKNTLTENQERWVAMHEVLHWAKFASNGVPQMATQQIYRDEMRGVVGNIRFDADRFHWDADAMSGTHRASGKGGSAEIMTPIVAGTPFLSAATLNELSPKRIIGRRWCTASARCPGDDPCVEVNPYVPRICGSGAIVGSGGHALPDTDPNSGEVSDDAALAIVLGSIGGTAFIVAIGWCAWSRSRRRERTDVSSTLPTAWLLAE